MASPISENIQEDRDVVGAGESPANTMNSQETTTNNSNSQGTLDNQDMKQCDDVDEGPTNSQGATTNNNPQVQVLNSQETNMASNKSQGTTDNQNVKHSAIEPELETSTMESQETIGNNPPGVQVPDQAPATPINLQGTTANNNSQENIQEMEVQPDEVSAMASQESMVNTSSEVQALDQVPAMSMDSHGSEGNTPLDNSQETMPSTSEVFTTEIFKIEIGNLPKMYSINHMKKLLLKLQLQPKKIKLIPNKNFAFVTFKCEEDRQQALKVLQDYEYRHKILTAKIAKALEDPIGKKIKKEDNNPPLSNIADKNNSELDITTRLRNAVSPLWNTPYEQQITMKYEAMVKTLKKLTRQLLDANAGAWVHKQRTENNGMCCPLENPLPSPDVTEYRNKCEFSIGKGDDGTGKVVGFRLGMYKDGFCTVVEPTECTNIPESMKQVSQVLQSYISNSPFDVFNPQTYQGFWKQLSVRTTCSEDMMCILEIISKNMPKTDLDAEIEKLTEHFRQQNIVNVTSLYVNIAESSSNNSEGNLVHVLGEKHIFETMRGMKFRISPNAFFQVNTKAAEMLYKTVQEWSEVTPNTLVLDICCGTGTIGLSMAKSAKKVIGVEMCEAAVADAKFNASLNDITNAEFICGKAEHVIVETTNNLKEDSIVGIVDPPRAGCHARVIQAIRRCSNLNRLIYISCSPNSVLKDFVDLCRPTSKRNKGQPFHIVKAIPVDLFPQTHHCELIVLLQRS